MQVMEELGIFGCDETEDLGGGRFAVSWVVGVVRRAVTPAAVDDGKHGEWGSMMRDCWVLLLLGLLCFYSAEAVELGIFSPFWVLAVTFEDGVGRWFEASTDSDQAVGECDAQKCRIMQFQD